MAVILFDGFDFYTQSSFTGSGIPLSSRWTLASLPIAAMGYANTGRYGAGRTLRIPSVNTSLQLNMRIPFGANYTSLAFGFAMKVVDITDWGTAGTGKSVCILNDSAIATQLQFNLDSNGNFVAFRGATNIGTSSGRPILTNTWHYVEVEVVVNDSTGSVKIWVDETQVLNLTGIDSCNTANVNVASFTIYAQSNAAAAWDLDDLYITDGTRLGEQVVVPLRPSADTAQKDFTPNSGSTNYTQVDDPTADNDSTYVSSSTVGARDYYELDNLPSYAVSPKGVNSYMSARKIDAGARYLRINLKSSSSLASSSDLALSTSYDTKVMSTFTDPNGGGSWTTSAINALQVGPEITL